MSKSETSAERAPKKAAQEEPLSDAPGRTLSTLPEYPEEPGPQPAQEPSPASLPSPSPALRSPGSELSQSGKKAAYTLAPGSSVERYLLIKPLGVGGMGVVYAAYDPELDRKVALKLLRPDQRTPRGHSEREWMLREAQAMARVSHPNVISVYDVGTYENQVFMAMEFIQGTNLSDWLRQAPGHPWQECLRVFQEAGQGLKAAHAAGLVHRDFKPANVLLGDNGRVCVLDFGLARLAREAEAEEEARSGEAPSGGLLGDEQLALELSEASELLVGTPQYMAPEQYLINQVDARADQFAFCSALYWALYRKRPFDPRQLARTASATARTARSASKGSKESWRLLPPGNAAHEPPANSPVPAWVRRAVMRGLSLNPDNRFASMGELLEALSQGQRQGQRRRALLAVGSTVALAAAGVGLYAFQQSQVCAGSESLAASAWGPQARQQVEAAFTAVGGNLAGDTARRVVSLLDGYSGSWAAMHTEACQATRVRGEQTEELLSLRMVCLERRRQDLAALAGLLATADAKLVEKAVETAAALPSLQPCQDIASLAEQPPLPADPLARTTIEKLGPQVDQVILLHVAGRAQEAVELARKLEPQVAATAYLPLQAELRTYLGWSLQHREAPEGIRLLEQSFDAALSSRSDQLALDAVTRMLFVMANNGRAAEAVRWGQVARALLQRLGNVQPQALELMGHLGYVALMQGHYKEARDFFEKAHVMAETVLPPDHPKWARVTHARGLAALRLADHPRAIALFTESLKRTEAAKGRWHPELATRHTMLATAYRESGDLNKALEHVLVALVVRRATQGHEHPAVADTLDELGMDQLALKRYGEALGTFREALAIKQKALGEDHPDLSYSYDGIGQALLLNGSAAEAIEPLRKALAYEDAEPQGRAMSGFALARALWESGRDRKQAREEARKAREIYVKLESAAQVKEIDTWLSAHP
jgi:tetratricopeptide (TPR) repeat protein